MLNGNKALASTRTRVTFYHTTSERLTTVNTHTHVRKRYFGSLQAGAGKWNDVQHFKQERVFSGSVGSFKGTRIDKARRTCNKCNKTFNSINGFKYHMSRHTGQYDYWCEKCLKGFNLKNRFDKHMLQHN